MSEPEWAKYVNWQLVGDHLTLQIAGVPGYPGRLHMVNVQQFVDSWTLERLDAAERQRKLLESLRADLDELTDILTGAEPVSAWAILTRIGRELDAVLPKEVCDEQV